MKAVLKWTAIGIGTLVGLFLILTIVVALTMPPAPSGQGGRPAPAEEPAGQQAADKPAPAAEPAAEPAPEPVDPTRDRVRVEISASAPVDVMILPTDPRAPTIMEQISRPESYELEVKEGSGLLAGASTPNLKGGADVHVAVYVDGKLVAEDYDGAYAQVEF